MNETIFQSAISNDGRGFTIGQCRVTFACDGNRVIADVWKDGTREKQLVANYFEFDRSTVVRLVKHVETL